MARSTFTYFISWCYYTPNFEEVDTPNFEEVDGAYWFRVVRASVRNIHAISCEPCMLRFLNFIYGFLMENS